MYNEFSSPVKDVTLGDAMKISLDNYYDILKAQTGGLGSNEFLQLKLVADAVDVSSTKEEDNYKWFSYYNLLKRSDLAIDNSPIADTILTGAVTLADVYGKFLRKLRNLVVYSELSQEDKDKLDYIDTEVERLKEVAIDLFETDSQRWSRYCEVRGIETGDQSIYIQWSSRFGNIGEIENIHKKITYKKFERKTIINRKFPNADDQEIVDAEILFDDPRMRLRYPIHPDYEYSSELTAEYLVGLPYGSTALYDDRRVINWDKTLDRIRELNVGRFTATLDTSSQRSESIKTDWGGSSSVRYGFIKVKSGGSGFSKISEDFKKTKNITLSAESTMKVNINYGSWFKPNLFEHKRVKENPDLFLEFFGENGSLKYYPTALILLRGFGISFKTTAKWTYDYEKKFKASGGGGFRAFGINFGGKAKYGKHVKEHKVDRSETELKITDDSNSIRFVGYVVKKNEPLKEELKNIANSIYSEDETKK